MKHGILLCLWAALVTLGGTVSAQENPPQVIEGKLKVVAFPPKHESNGILSFTAEDTSKTASFPKVGDFQIIIDPPNRGITGNIGNDKVVFNRQSNNKYKVDFTLNCRRLDETVKYTVSAIWKDADTEYLFSTKRFDIDPPQNPVFQSSPINSDSILGLGYPIKEPTIPSFYPLTAEVKGETRAQLILTAKEGLDSLKGSDFRAIVRFSYPDSSGDERKFLDSLIKGAFPCSLHNEQVIVTVSFRRKALKTAIRIIPEMEVFNTMNQKVTFKADEQKVLEPYKGKTIPWWVYLIIACVLMVVVAITLWGPGIIREKRRKKREPPPKAETPEQVIRDLEKLIKDHVEKYHLNKEVQGPINLKEESDALKSTLVENVT